MDKKAQSNVGMIVVLFIGIVFSIALLAPIFNTQAEMTTKLDVTDESTNLSVSCYGDELVNESNTACNITVTNAPLTGWRSNGGCPIDNVVVTNGSGTAFTEDTDYIVYANSGLIQMLDTEATNQTNNVNGIVLTDYDYCGAGYNKDSGSRSVAGLMGLFSVLILLGFILEKTGLTNFTNK